MTFDAVQQLVCADKQIFENEYVIYMWFAMWRHLHPGTVVGTIEATDDDEPPNSNLEFYIESGNLDDMFALQTNGNANQREVVFAQSSQSRGIVWPSPNEIVI